MPDAWDKFFVSFEHLNFVFQLLMKGEKQQYKYMNWEQ
jgi:hypothetical protein